MAEELASRVSLAMENGSIYQQLQEFNANLEAMVAERTEALRQLNSELERSNQELQDFAYVASHDLQEPLRKIQAFGNLLEEEYGPNLNEGKTYIDRMRNAASRMQVLINDLLMFSRVTTKALPFSPVDLNVIAQEVVIDLESLVQKTRGTVEVAPLPTIEADPLQMRQLLQNLLGNALKFHKPDVPPLVRVSAEVCVDPHTNEEQCLLTVEDNGIGFDEKYLDRIFTVFQRLHGRGEYEGTGIGLAVVRKIVERHSGTITAKSAVGEGATFLVTLQVHQKAIEGKVV
jgi:light-regulated signal transduction histidine kinase (bacteriophytochrome)